MNPKWAKAFKWEEGIFPGSEVLRNLQCRKTHLVKGKLESLTWLSICEMCWVVLTVWSLKCRSHWTKTLLLSRCHVIWDLIPECLDLFAGVWAPTFLESQTEYWDSEWMWTMQSRCSVNHVNYASTICFPLFSAGGKRWMQKSLCMGRPEVGRQVGEV